MRAMTTARRPTPAATRPNRQRRMPKANAAATAAREGQTRDAGDQEVAPEQPQQQRQAPPSMEAVMADPRASLAAGGLADGPPRFWCPLESANAPPDAPLLLYIPGLDGTGFAAMRQWESMTDAFCLECLTIPPADRTNARDLAALIADRIRRAKEEEPRRKVCVVGESMGGLLALLAASEAAPCIDRLFVANPASSFDRTVWAQAAPLFPGFPEPVYEALPVVLAPVLIDPVRSTERVIARTVRDDGGDADNVDIGALLATDPGSIADALLSVLTGFQRTLIECLPKATLAHRLELLREGCAALDDAALRRISCSTVVFAGSRDLLLPSTDEAARLKEALARCTTRTFPDVSHALLQDPTVDFSRAVQELASYPITQPRRARRRMPARDAPLQRFDNWLPPRDADLAEAQRFLEPQRRLHSPVFLSTDSATGRVQRGLGALPPLNGGRDGNGHRPVLFVGNHQLLAGDLGQLIDGLRTEGGAWVRGLAHPFVVGAAGGGQQQAGAGNFLRRFGAVPVSGRSLVALLSTAEPCLLFPGGVREAYKRRGEQYQLIWPEKPEFVRAAGRYDAIIVPFGAVGAEDGLDIVLDSEEVRDLPFDLGRRAAERADAVRGPRGGGAADAQLAGESFLSPLAVPNGRVERWYFTFGQPVDMAADFAGAADDAGVAAAAYAEVRARVRSSLDYASSRRSSDPFSSLVPRLAYESLNGRSAPTFPLA